MVKSVLVTLEWADGEYPFALYAEQIEELEAVCQNPTTGKHGVGIGAIWMRLMGGNWFASDVYNIIRLGLIGGGAKPIQANRLVKTYAKNLPLSALAASPTPDNPVTVAQAILAAAMIGVEADEEERQEPVEGESETPND